MVVKLDDKFFLQLLVGSSLRWRFIRYGILWTTVFLLIYRGFRFLANTMSQPTVDNIKIYTCLSTLLFGCLTLSAFGIVTILTNRFIIQRFKIGLFTLSLLLIHGITAEVVLWHFRVFTRWLALPKLPRFYTTYADHIAQLKFWQAPFDGVIVWFFSFSLFYNYLIYAVGLKVFKDLFVSVHRRNELEKENLRLEFDFLKAQINPHFLFNTLNNIYSFSIKSPDRVAGTVLKLADLMRYSLYETNEEFVPLSNELSYIANYVDLQRIRHEDNVQISFSVEGQPASQVISPLLLIVFVENAFKHGIQASAQASRVEIRLVITDQKLTMHVENSVPPKRLSGIGGIGLRNVRKRLEYFYPNRHQLIIRDKSHQYEVALTLNIHESTLPRYHR